MKSFILFLWRDYGQRLNIFGMVTTIVVLSLTRNDGSWTGFFCWLYAYMVQAVGIAWSLIRTRRNRKRFIEQRRLVEFWKMEAQMLLAECNELPEWHPELPEKFGRYKEIAHRWDRELKLLVKL